MQQGKKKAVVRPKNKQQGLNEPDLKIEDLRGRWVESPQYGRGMVAEVKGSMIIVAFNKGMKRVAFDAAIAIKKQSLQFGPAVQKPKQKAGKKGQGTSKESTPKKTSTSTSKKPDKKVSAARIVRVQRGKPKKSKDGTVNNNGAIQGSESKEKLLDTLSNQTWVRQEQPTSNNTEQKGKASSIPRKCSNCRLSKNPERCGHGLLGPCDDWVEATSIEEHWPTWEDMKRANREDLRSRYRG